MELRFGGAGVFGALAYSYLLYELSEGRMVSASPDAGFHWMVVYWLAATAFAVGWNEHQNLDWVRMARALGGYEPVYETASSNDEADLAAAE